eukprot:COSAG01_NODE_1445_length_10281_cov_33.445099_18_plen_109_part_00
MHGPTRCHVRALRLWLSWQVGKTDGGWCVPLHAGLSLGRKTTRVLSFTAWVRYSGIIAAARVAFNYAYSTSTHNAWSPERVWVRVCRGGQVSAPALRTKRRGNGRVGR